MKLHFEGKIDWTCVMALVAIVKAGELQEKRTEAIDHALFLAGSINATLAESSEEEVTVFSEQSVANELDTEHGLMAQLDTLLSEHKEEKGVTVSTIGPKKVNPQLVAVLKKLASVVISQLM